MSQGFTKGVPVDTDVNLAANSDLLIPSQKAVKTYVDTHVAAGSGTVTSVGLSAGTGISVGGTNPVTTSGTITVTNTAPDQTVVLTAGTGINTSGTYPNFTITNSSPDQTVSLTAGTGISVTGSYPNFTVTNTASTGGASKGFAIAMAIAL